MAQPLQVKMPPLVLDAGCVIRFEAINATTGAPVANVAVTDVAIYGTHDRTTGQAVEDAAPLWLSVPDLSSAGEGG
jgi:hypothetical protein